MSIMPTSNYRGGNFAPSIDKMLGNSFYTVKQVADELERLAYIVDNLQKIIFLAEEFAAITAMFPGGPPSTTNVEAFVAVLNTVVGALPTIEPVGTPALWLNGGVFAYSRQQS